MCIYIYIYVSVSDCVPLTIVSHVVTFPHVFHLPFTTSSQHNYVFITRKGKWKISKNAIKFYCRSRRCHVCIASTHTHIYHMCATPTLALNLLCQTGPYIRRICQPLSMASRPAGSVDLPTIPIEPDDYWFPTKLVESETERERVSAAVRASACMCVCVRGLCNFGNFNVIKNNLRKSCKWCAKQEETEWKCFEYLCNLWQLLEQTRATMANIQQADNNNDSNSDCYHSYSHDVCSLVVACRACVAQKALAFSIKLQNQFTNEN